MNKSMNESINKLKKKFYVWIGLFLTFLMAVSLYSKLINFDENLVESKGASEIGEELMRETINLYISPSAEDIVDFQSSSTRLFEFIETVPEDGNLEDAKAWSVKYQEKD